MRLLKAEYTKLQKNYAELERKYSKVAAANGENDVGEFSSFVSRLAMTVATLYGRKTYSDIIVRLSDKTVPGHKFVLNARSEEWNEDVLADITELGELQIGAMPVNQQFNFNSNFCWLFRRLVRSGNGRWLRIITLAVYGCH